MNNLITMDSNGVDTGGGEKVADAGPAVYSVPESYSAARFNAERYEQEYRRSIDDPDAFWGDVGRRLEWIQPFSRVKDVSFQLDDFHIRWYEDGILNISHNCLDRHLAEHGE